MQVRDRHGAEPQAIAAVAPIAGRRLLEVGCGEGRLTRFAASLAREVYAFDPAGDSVARARAALPPELRDRVSFGVHDARRWTCRGVASTSRCAGGRCDASSRRAS